MNGVYCQGLDGSGGQDGGVGDWISPHRDMLAIEGKVMFVDDLGK